MNGQPIYLDHNATTPLDPAVLAEMLPFLSGPPTNPSSAHSFGRKARQAVERSRERIAAGLDCDPKEVVFTSGATEANNLACNVFDKPGRAIVSAVEHPSALDPVSELKKRDCEVEVLGVDGRGLIDVEAFDPGDSRLVCIQFANSETGVVQPIAELAVKRGTARFHCDAVQAVGKIPLSFRNLGVTSLSISGHKINGPQGIGALIVRRDSPILAMMYGGGQQSGFRPGTEPVANIVGLAAAVEKAVVRIAEDSPRIAELRDRFESMLLEQHPSLTLNPGVGVERLPNTANISFPGVPAAAMVMRLDLEGIACSAGSACSSGSMTPSKVLSAMGFTGDRLLGAVRFSLGRFTSTEEIERAVEIVAKVYHSVREGFGR
jgi:cysteine desulfurase